MIPPALSLFFDKCARGEATASEYVKALVAVEKAFGQNQQAVTVRADSLRDDRHHFVQPDNMIAPYSDRQMVAAGDV